MMEILFVFTLLCLGGLGTVEAIKEFSIQDMLMCGSTFPMTYYGDLYSMRLKLTNQMEYWKNLDCQIIVRAETTEKLMLYFEYMDIEETNSCTNDWLEVYDGESRYAPYVTGLTHRLCGFSAPPDVYHTSSNYLTVYMKSNDYLEYKGFSLIITRYHDEPCLNVEFECNNGHCINKTLVCDGYNPCGDHSDCNTPAPDHGVIVVLHLKDIIGISCGTFVLLLVVVIACVVLARKRRNRVYRERDHIITVENSTTYGTSEGCNNSAMPPPYSKQALPPDV